MRRKLHPLSGSVYEEAGEGLVRVVKGEQYGLFRANGQWVEGDVTSADPHMLVWVGGREIPADLNAVPMLMDALPQILHD